VTDGVREAECRDAGVTECGVVLATHSITPTSVLLTIRNTPITVISRIKTA